MPFAVVNNLKFYWLIYEFVQTNNILLKKTENVNYVIAK